MYNRYIPQADGSYQRKRMQEPQRPQPKPKAEPPHIPQEPECVPSPEPPCTPPKRQERCHNQSYQKQEACSDGFLRQLLPKDFDTGDLLVILLLLLMAGDCPEDRSTALLTIALYFIM